MHGVSVSIASNGNIFKIPKFQNKHNFDPPPLEMKI